MKRKVYHLSFIVFVLVVFSFVNIAFAQGKQIKAKTNKVEKTAVEQPVVEEQQIEQPAVTPPEVEIKNTEVKKNEASHGLSLSFGYDFLAKFKKTKIVPTSDEGTTLDSFNSSDESAKYMDLKLTYSFFTDIFRFGFGLGFILPHDYDNKFKYQEEDYTNTHVTVEFKQELNFGIYLQLIQFGYKIDLDYVKLVPYIGLNVLYLQAQDSFDPLETTSDGKTTIHKVTIPINFGLDVIFANAGPMSFYAGLEFGYAIKVVYEYSTEGWHYTGKYGERVVDESDPLTGLMGKAILGTSFNF